MTFPDTSVHEALPTNVRPVHYNVHLYDMDVQKNTFKGVVNVTFDVHSATRAVTLNQKFLEFEWAKAVASITKTKTEIPVERISKNDAKETVEFALGATETPLTKGTLELAVGFSGRLRTDMCGFYTSPYDTQGSSDKQYILVTQFESAEARSAFPCYDEPNVKATFDISLVVREELTALSNMPVASSKTLDDGKKGPGFGSPLKNVRFETTPKMSTYLVAWAIGKFDHVEGHTAKLYNGAPLPIRVYTIPGQAQNGQFALSVAQNDVDYLSGIFDVAYPLPKLDLVAIPQFGANAMENWGMVTFRATALLFDPAKSDASYRQNVAYVVSHEIAHSWFGNYVTMNWWSDLWLNESFATWVGSLCVEVAHPEWEIFTDFVTNGVEVALNLDSLRNSHPIEVQVNTASEIDEIFDHISYLKGGSIIRMVASAVGVEVFLKGVSNYLKKYAFGNARSDDLWDEVSKVYGKDITKLVAPWIRAVGYPYIAVSEDGSDLLSLKQSRFFSSGDAKPEEDQIVWWIPNVPELADGAKTAQIPKKGFLKLNKNTEGFYRVVYDRPLFDNIVRHLDELSSEDRIGLIADTAAGSQAGLLQTSQLLLLLDALKDSEADVTVWLEIVKRLSTLNQLYFSDPAVLARLRRFSQSLYKARFTQLSEQQGELSFRDAKLRSMLFVETGSCGLPGTIAQAQKLFASGSIDPSLRLGVYKTLLSNKETCTRKNFDAIMDEVKHPSAIDSKEIALKALGAISDTSFVDEVLALYFSPYVLEMDYLFLTVSLVDNPATKEQFWDFFKTHYNQFHEDVARWTLDRLIKNFLPELVSADLYKDITAFFATKDTEGYDKGLRQGLDSIKNSLAWEKAARDDVDGWLTSKGF